MPFICCVPGCGENGKKFLHSFPKDKIQCRKWIQSTWCFHLNKETAWKTHYKICRKHFREMDLRNGNLLKKGIVPSLMLPHSITMEHDYCESTSIVVNTNAGRASLEETNINHDCIMTELVETRQVEHSTGNSAVQNETNECIENSTEEEIHHNIVSESETPDQSLRNPEKINAGSFNDGGITHKENDAETESTVSAPTTEPKAKTKYDPVARKMKYLLKRNKELSKKLKDSEAANLKSNKKSKVKRKIDVVLKTLSSQLPPAHYNFINLQLKNTGKAKKGNRFTSEEKTLALVIYKQNPKRYKELLKMANLPTKRTLIAHSASIRFKEGINSHLMNFIKEEVSELSELDKMCTIGWDEMSLTANLTFDQIKDYIDGFEDIGSKRTNDFATHALVFMVRGIQSPYKQPIAYYLTQNLNAAELSELIKLVTEAVMDTGLKVIGSVCDAVATNRAAVNRLMYPNSRRSNTTGMLLEYSINGTILWHYFDPPHLIKSVRNNLLTKDLNHLVSFNELKFRRNGALAWNEKNKQQRTASWKDVDDFYRFNDTGLFNLIPNITPEHMNPVKRKMKVSLATQVFSGTYGRNMYLCAKRKQFLNNCIGTSAVLLFFNELFDSVNGGNVSPTDKLVGAVTAESEHFKFWEYAIRMLDNMSYTANLTTGRPNQSNVCKHFVSTLKAFRRISEHLFETGVKTIGLRRFNQDGLENQFFKIRSYCGSNPKPNARDFRNAYTTSIFNNQMTSHSINANCEADDDKYVLKNLHVLYGNDTTDDVGLGSKKKIGECVNANTVPAQTGLFDNTPFAEDEAQNCVSAKICKQIINKFKCDSCLVTVAVNASTKPIKCIEHDIMRKQSTSDGIVLPNLEFIKCIKSMLLIVQKMLPDVCSEKNLTMKLLSGIPDKKKFESIGCDIHRNEFFDQMWKCTTKQVIEKFTTQVNRILSGKVTITDECIIQKKALEFKAKKKHIGKYIPPLAQ
ncbi:hypothetical protein HA402_014399 [Bradysia odoriphaga]|nr:hypothetical protein HA402_014399 [Bradysia odoriphaga]